MENTSANASVVLDDTHFVNLVVNCVLSAITLYLLVAFCFYEYTTFYWNVGNGSLDEKHNKISRILRALCIVGTSFAFIHHVCEIIAPFMTTTAGCQAMSTMWLLTYALGILTAYIFLWQRQHWLYEGPALKHLLNGCIKAFSWIALVFLIISAITVFLAGSRMIFFSSCGESSEDSKRLKLYETILVVTLLVLTVLGQTQLLILFIIPLRSHTSKLRKSAAGGKREPSDSSNAMNHADGRSRADTASSPGIGRSKSKKKSSHASILSLVKRCLLLASISMVSDIIAAAVTLFTESASGKIVYDMNILINVMCCVGSFKMWTSMIFPWKRTRSASKRKERISAIQNVFSSSGVHNVVQEV